MDTLRRVRGCDARIGIATRLEGPGYGVEWLLEDRLGADEFSALLLELLTRFAHLALDRVGQVSGECGRFELVVDGGPRELEAGGVRQRAFGVEEDVGHVDSHSLADPSRDDA